MRKIAVIGAGAWGTTLASLLTEKKNNVYLWSHSPNHMPETIAHVSTSLEIVLQNAEIVIMAVASKFYRTVLEKVSLLLSENVLILIATKGLELSTGKRMTQVTEEVLSKLSGQSNPEDKIAVISGPNLAREIKEKNPAATVIASKNQKSCLFFQELFSTSYFRVYTNNDVLGVELSGALKNVFAIAAGIIDGFGLGSNIKAAMLVRGITETVRFGLSLGAKKETFFGLSGLGDLFATCNSNLSRNYQVGISISSGQSIKDVESKLTQVAEGINTTKAVFYMSQELAVEMPIVEQIYNVLFCDKDPYKAITDLMLRRLKEE